ncbi:hypothetical protein DTO271G3_7887 [Paecilomyces variotii]|nr:hypothetical protein DTO271G3_7887 [Paecilomyces variotii]
MPPSNTDNPQDDTRDPSPSSSALSLSRSLLHQCRLLLAELDAFQSAVNEKFRRPQIIEIRQLRSSVVSELRGLEKMHEQAEKAAADEATRAGDDSDDRSEEEKHRELKLLHALRSSNLQFYMAVWTIAKRSCCGLVAFGKRFYWDDGSRRHEQQQKGNGVENDSNKGKNKGNTGNKDKDKKKSVFVDIVAGEGEEWVKVSTISESRLLFEMAKKGWEMDEDEDEDTDGGNRTILRNYGSDQEEDSDDEIELIKLAADLTKAARSVRINYRHPRTRVVIPKIVEGRIPEIDKIFGQMRQYGTTVECGTSLPLDLMNDGLDSDRDPETVTPEQLPLGTLLPNPFKRFTKTLNVDCTLLLAFVSDLSHFREIPPSPGYHRAILRQIEMEKEQPLVPTELWPAVDGHDLICTKEAAKRMREIVDTIGTDAEKRRTEILMGSSAFENLDRESLIRKFQELSDHPVPSKLILPIRVVDAETGISAGWENGRLPSVAHKVEESLSDINRSVFLYGWSTGIMTISSNRTVVKQIENIVEENRNGNDELEGPLVWVCDTARSLVGKEKNRK